MIDTSSLLSPENETPIYIQLVDALRREIVRGALSEGTRLPSSRGLAHDLGISRSTVIQSYDQLAAEGYLVARRGSGMFVADISPLAEVSPHPTGPQPQQNRDRHTPTLLRPGTPDPSLFPTRIWARTLARVARNTPDALCVLKDPFGDEMLRAEIATYLKSWRGITCSPEQILVTSGAREALELAINLVIEGQDIGLESPGFAPLHRFVAAAGWSVRWMRPNSHGPDLPETLPKVTVLTPSHQFPLGGTMPVAQRRAFLDAAHHQNAWIIEDDFDSEFRYAGQPVPAMAGLDQTGRCLYVGTFSKTFSHAIRLGYLVLPQSLIQQMRDGFIHPSAGAGITAQRPMAQFMADGQYDRHIRRARRHYASRYEATIDALQKWPTHWGTFSHHRAGMQIAFHLSPDVDDVLLCKMAATDGFGVQALSGHDPVGNARGVLIGFCGTETDEIDTLITRLGKHVARAYESAF